MHGTGERTCTRSQFCPYRTSENKIDQARSCIPLQAVRLSTLLTARLTLDRKMNGLDQLRSRGANLLISCKAVKEMLVIAL